VALISLPRPRIESAAFLNPPQREFHQQSRKNSAACSHRANPALPLSLPQCSFLINYIRYLKQSKGLIKYIFMAAVSRPRGCQSQMHVIIDLNALLASPVHRKPIDHQNIKNKYFLRFYVFFIDRPSKKTIVPKVLFVFIVRPSKISSRVFLSLRIGPRCARPPRRLLGVSPRCERIIGGLFAW